MSESIPKKSVQACRARWLHVKSNLVCFYPEHGLIAKTRRPFSVRDASAFDCEYQRLCELQQIDARIASVPEGYLEEPFPALWLRLSPGRRLRDQEKEDGAAQIADKLLNLYEATGIEYRTLGELDDPYTPSTPDIAWLQERSWTADEAHPIAAALERIGTWKVPTAMIHGDIMTSNALLEPDGNVRIIDWEQSRRAPVFFDMARLCARHPNVRASYQAWKKRIGYETRQVQDEIAALRLTGGLDLEHFRTRTQVLRPNRVEEKVQAHRRGVLEYARALLDGSDQRGA
nr:phosphotransferase [Halorhodospira halophila]